MTAPLAGAAAKAVQQTATKGGRVSKERMKEVRKERRDAAKAEKNTAPASELKPESKPQQPKPETKPTPKPKSSASTTVSVPQPVSSGAGFVLALMFWTWVALPFLRDGMPGVRAQLKAKFTNKAPDGSWLP